MANPGPAHTAIAANVTRRRLLAMAGAAALSPTATLAEQPENLMCGVLQPVPGGYRQLGYHLRDRRAIGITGMMRIDLTLDPETPWSDRKIPGRHVVKSAWSQLSVSDADQRETHLSLVDDQATRNRITADIEKIRSDAAGPATRGWLDLKLVPDRQRKNVLIPVQLTLQLPPLGNAFQSLRHGVSLNILADDRLVLTDHHRSDRTAELGPGSGPAPSLVRRWDPASTSPTRDELMVRSVAQALLRDQEIRIEARSLAGDAAFDFRPSRPFKWSEEYPGLVRLQPNASRVATAAINGDVSGCE